MHFLSLPRELLLNVVELSSSSSKPKQSPSSSLSKYDRRTLLLLALVSTRLATVVEYILYHTLFVTSPRTLKLLARTARTESGKRRLTRNVENLSIGDIRGYTRRDEDLNDILRAVGQVRNVAIAVGVLPLSASPSSSLTLSFPTPTHLTLSSLPPLSHLHSLLALLRHTTHLTFHSPPDKWVDPLPLLLSLPKSTLAQTTHLSLPRREHSNSENDELFISCLISILSTASSPFTNLSTLLIRIFPIPGSDTDRSAEIWSSLSAIPAIVTDKRVIVKAGDWEGPGWIGEWEEDVRGRGDLWK